MVECQVTMVECQEVPTYETSPLHQEATTYETPSLSSKRFHSNVSNLESKVDLQVKLQVKLRQWRGMMRGRLSSCRGMMMTGARRSSLVCSSLVFPSLCLPPSLSASHWLSVHEGGGDGLDGVHWCMCGMWSTSPLASACRATAGAPVDRLPSGALSIFHVRVSS